MRNSFDHYVRVAAATPKIEVANCTYNADRIIELMQKARAQGVHLLCLPELCITGSTCGGLFLQPTLINGAKEALHKLVEVSKDMDMAVVVGLPLEDVGKLYNVAAVFSRGQILGYVPKTDISKPFVKLLSNTWHERRFPFATDMLFYCEHAYNFAFAVEIGTDLLMPIPPSTRHARHDVNIIVNIAATSEFVNKPNFRRSMVAGQSARLGCGYIYANAGYGESTTDVVFGGHNIIAENGIILQESPPFGDGWAVSEIDITALVHDRRKKASIVKADDYFALSFSVACPTCEMLTRKIDPLPFIKGKECAEEALAIQAAGLAKRIEHTNSTAVIGVSGGLDSCLALLVTVRAYELLSKPVSEIIAVTMPGFGTTSHTKYNAHRLCEALGVQCREIDITASVTQHLKDIDHPLDKHDIVFENAQARMRTYVLMDLANQVNGLVVGTGSLSELALGWATYNGDHMSMYAVNAGVPKTLVRHIVDHIADTSDDVDLKKVLNSILATKVSPELLPAQHGEISQVTEDLVGPYELHDFFIYHTLRFCRKPKATFHLAQHAFDGKYSAEEILHWQKTFYNRFFSQQFKRSCLPDGPQVVEVSLSPRAGFQMPSDASAQAWLRELDAIRLS